MLELAAFLRNLFKKQLIISYQQYHNKSNLHNIQLIS
jgi:hypothetical protein